MGKADSFGRDRFFLVRMFLFLFFFLEMKRRGESGLGDFFGEDLSTFLFAAIKPFASHGSGELRRFSRFHQSWRDIFFTSNCGRKGVKIQEIHSENLT